MGRGMERVCAVVGRITRAQYEHRLRSGREKLFHNCRYNGRYTIYLLVISCRPNHAQRDANIPTSSSQPTAATVLTRPSLVDESQSYFLPAAPFSSIAPSAIPTPTAITTSPKQQPKPEDPYPSTPSTTTVLPSPAQSLPATLDTDLSASPLPT